MATLSSLVVEVNLYKFLEKIDKRNKNSENKKNLLL